MSIIAKNKPNKIESFSRDWWFDFIQKNVSFSETQVYRNAFSENLIAILNKGVHQMLQSRINRLDIGSGFRLYVDGIQVRDEDVIKMVKENKLQDGDDIEAYCRKNFGTNFGIITNYGEKHSEILSNTILESIKPLFDIIGIPPWGVELTTFIGNYGWTPLGIHRDKRGENVLHFHLGSGKKSMYVWDENVYEKVGKGVSNNKNIEPILKYAKKHEFGAGDLYYMPWNKYHIGYSGDFSIGVTLWFNNPTRHDFSELMIDTMKNLYLKNDQSIIESQIDYLNNENTLDDFLNTLSISKSAMNSSLRDFLKETYMEYKKCLTSNGGWQNTPLVLHKNLDDKKDFHPNLYNESIVRNGIYDILTEKLGDRLNIYVRGAKLSFKYFPEIVKVIQTINKGAVVKVTSLVQNHSALPQEVILYILRTLINNRGIKAV